jgi:UDP-glucose 4-epimerase
MKNNAIITGGAGFVASHLAESLIEKYQIVYLIDNLIRTSNLRNIQSLLDKYPARLKFINADVSTYDFDDISVVDDVYHLAATRINRCVSKPKEGHDFNTTAGFNVVNYCAEKHKRLFFASSASVYDTPIRFPILESDSCKPPTLYGAAKLYTENIMKTMLKHKGQYAINRFFSVYGPRMDCEGAYTEVIFNWLSNIKNGNKNIVVYGDPQLKTLDLVYVKDVVSAIESSFSNPENDTFNVSTESGTTLMELIRIIERVTGKQLNVTVFPENRTDIENKRVGSTQKLKTLGWNPKFSVEDGIAETYNWIKTI